VMYLYKDDSQPGSYRQWEPEELEWMAGQVQRREPGSYPEVDEMLYLLLDGPPDPVHHGLVDQPVAIIGSSVPWYEVLALTFGASQTVTIEYNQLRYPDPRMVTMTPGEYWRGHELEVRPLLAQAIKLHRDLSYPATRGAVRFETRVRGGRGLGFSLPSPFLHLSTTGWGGTATP